MIRTAIIPVARLTIPIALIAAAIPAWAQTTSPRVDDHMLRVTQMDASSQPIGVTQETRCPINGCQLASLLLIGTTTTSLQTVVTFAGQGVYVVLESRGTGTQIHLYGDPRPAPLFLPKTAGNFSRTVHIAIDQPSAGRQAQARQLTAQDTYLRIEINQAPTDPASPRQAG
jgi:hypothetical protein